MQANSNFVVSVLKWSIIGINITEFHIDSAVKGGEELVTVKSMNGQNNLYRFVSTQQL